METTTTTKTRQLDTCEFCGAPTDIVYDDFELADDPIAICRDCNDYPID